MTPDAARWLLTEEGDRVVASLAGFEPTPAAVAALRERVGDPARASAAIELAELRQRARAKFAAAERMVFTRKGYEQATDEWVARYKARRFAGRGRVVDACCGVGGDLAALAAVADASGVDADPIVAAFAQHNTGAPVAARRLTAERPPDADAWHADPDRRPQQRRTSQPDRHEPSLETLDAWRRGVADAAIKFAPAARLPSAWVEACELEWISRRGECRQLVAWCGAFAMRPGERVATRVDGDEACSLAGTPGIELPAAERLGEWLYEPDNAVLAAGLVGALAAKQGLLAATPAAPYLTGDRPVDDPLVASFRVVEALPLDRKRIAGWLAERGVGRLEIKVRGVDLSPERFRRELKPKGDRAMTLIVFPDADRKPRVVVAERASL